MRKFNCSGTFNGADITLWGAADAGLAETDMDPLADLQVGQTYVDSDGDTWERIE